MSFTEEKIIQSSPPDRSRYTKAGAPTTKPRRDDIIPIQPLVGNPPSGFDSPPTYPIEILKPLTKPVLVKSDPHPPGYTRIEGK